MAFFDGTKRLGAPPRSRSLVATELMVHFPPRRMVGDVGHGRLRGRVFIPLAHSGNTGFHFQVLTKISAVLSASFSGPEGAARLKACGVAAGDANCAALHSMAALYALQRTDAQLQLCRAFLQVCVCVCVCVCDGCPCSRVFVS